VKEISARPPLGGNFKKKNSRAKGEGSTSDSGRTKARLVWILDPVGAFVIRKDAMADERKGLLQEESSPSTGKKNRSSIRERVDASGRMRTVRGKGGKTFHRKGAELRKERELSSFEEE